LATPNLHFRFNLHFSGDHFLTHLMCIFGEMSNQGLCPL
jgi:hypothetical protein